jgi:hypothetical protein
MCVGTISLFRSTIRSAEKSLGNCLALRSCSLLSIVTQAAVVRELAYFCSVLGLFYLCTRSLLTLY